MELSKVLMYEFHCNYNKSKYDDKSKLLFTGTDSLTHEMQKMKMSMNILARKKYLISVIIQLSKIL